VLWKERSKDPACPFAFIPIENMARRENKYFFILSEIK
jgi:hypothetical protein